MVQETAAIKSAVANKEAELAEHEAILKENRVVHQARMHDLTHGTSFYQGTSSFLPSLPPFPLLLLVLTYPRPSLCRPPRPQVCLGRRGRPAPHVHHDRQRRADQGVLLHRRRGREHVRVHVRRPGHRKPPFPSLTAHLSFLPSVVECLPKVQGIPQLLKEVNQSNDFSKFVCSMRGLFKATTV